MHNVFLMLLRMKLLHKFEPFVPPFPIELEVFCIHNNKMSPLAVYTQLRVTIFYQINYYKHDRI